MKRRDIKWMAVWFLVGLIFACCVVDAVDGAEITGPSASRVGTIATLSTNAVLPTWHIQPDPPAGASIISGDTLYLTSAVDATYLIGVTHGEELSMHLLVFGSGADDLTPPSPPIPDDPPTPPDPIPGITLTVIIEESSTSTQPQRQTMVALAQWMDSQEPGVPYRLIDQDIITGDGNKPAWATPIIDAVELDGDALPVIVFLGGEIDALEIKSIDALPLGGDAAIEYVTRRIAE